jgi:hypothetical protein
MELVCRTDADMVVVRNFRTATCAGTYTIYDNTLTDTVLEIFTATYGLGDAGVTDQIWQIVI